MALADALRLLEAVTPCESVREWLGAAAREVGGDTTLSATMEARADMFTPLWVRAVQAAEGRDELGQALRRLGEAEANRSWCLRQVRRAIGVPALLIVLFVCVTGFLLGGLVPYFGPIFRTFAVDLPGPTATLMKLSGWFQGSWGILLSSAAVVALLAFLFARTDEGKVLVRQWRLRVPLFGTAAHLGALSEFCQCLAAAIEAGCPLADGVEASMPPVLVHLAGEPMSSLRERLETDLSLSEALGNHKGLPTEAKRVIRLGESADSLVSALSAYADALRDRLKTLTMRTTTISYLAAIAASVIVVVVLIATMILPAFELQRAMGG